MKLTKSGNTRSKQLLMVPTGRPGYKPHLVILGMGNFIITVIFKLEIATIGIFTM